TQRMPSLWSVEIPLPKPIGSEAPSRVMGARFYALVIALRPLPDALEDVAAVTLRIGEGGAGGEDHDVGMEPDVYEGRAPEGHVQDHALLRLLPPRLAVHVVARARVDRADAVRVGAEEEVAGDVQAAADDLVAAGLVHP